MPIIIIIKALNIQKMKIMASGPITSWWIDGETMKTMTDFIFLGSKITADGNDSHEIQRHLLLGRKAMTNLESILKSRDITLQTKVYIVKAMAFPAVIMDVRIGPLRRLSTEELMLLHRGVGEDSWESLGQQRVNPKGNQSWIFIGRSDAEAEAPILCSPDAKSWLIRKDPDAGKDWRQEKGMTENKMVGWHHRFHGHELERAPGDGEGQGSLACCSPWGHRVVHDWATEQQKIKH